MDADLERRRLAIVRALRGQPALQPTTDRLARLEQDVAAVRREVRELRLRLADGGPDSAYLEAVDEVESPPVPPMEPAGPMRADASRALFGY